MRWQKSILGGERCEHSLAADLDRASGGFPLLHGARRELGGGGPPMFCLRKNSCSWHLSRYAFSFLDRGVLAHATKKYLVRLLATMLATLCNFLPPRSKICKHCALSMLQYWCMSFSNLLPWWVVVVLVVLSGVAIFCYCYRRFV